MSFTLSAAALVLISTTGHSMTVTQQNLAEGHLAPRAHLVEVNSASPRLLDEAQAYVDGLTVEGIGFLSDETLDQAARSKKFESLLNNNFDMDKIGRFALGSHWRSASKAQQSEYLKLFKEMIVKVYTRRFSEYQGQSVKVLSARAEGKSDILVSSVIVDNSGPNIKLDWRLRRSDGRFKVIDVIVEGVSMALTQRSEFSSVIQRGGGNVEVLLEHLREG